MDSRRVEAMKAILLIPAPGDPHRLLAAGKCGARAAYGIDRLSVEANLLRKRISQQETP